MGFSRHAVGHGCDNSVVKVLDADAKRLQCQGVRRERSTFGGTKPGRLIFSAISAGHWKALSQYFEGAVFLIDYFDQAPLPGHPPENFALRTLPVGRGWNPH